MVQGQLAEAAQAFGDSLAIRQQLAAGDPSNIDWQRDLSESFCNLANLAERQENIREARNYWNKALKVLAVIDKRGLHLSPEDRKLLETVREKASTDAH